MLSNSFVSSLFWPPPCIIRSNSAMFATSISATSVQYRSAQTSVMTRIFGMPTLALSLAIARNFSTKGRTFPGLQYMISRMRSMRVLPCVGWAQAAAGRQTGNYAEFPRSSSRVPQPSPALLLRRQQLSERRVVTQRPERRVEVHHAAARIPLSERLLHQRDRGIPLAQHRVDPRLPHRVPAVQIPRAHPLQRPLEPKCFVALPIARRNHAQKAQERQMIGRITRDDADPPHGGVIGGAVRRLRRETLEQAPSVVEPSA